MPQQNKPHKSRFASKGSTKRKTKGRVDRVKALQRRAVKLEKSGNQKDFKQRQQAKVLQQRKEKRAKILHEQRIGTAQGPPKIVGFMSLAANADPHHLRDRVATLLMGGLDVSDPSTNQAKTFPYHEQKQRMTLLSAATDLDRLLDLAKVVDIAVLVIRAIPDDTASLGRVEMDTSSANGECLFEDDGRDTQSSMGSMNSELNLYGMCIDAIGQKFLSMLTAVGLPTVMVALVGLATLPTPKMQRRALRLHTQYFRDLFSNETKVIPCDRPQQLQYLMRTMSQTKLRKIRWRELQPYMVVDKTEWKAEDGEDLLCVHGYLRGQHLSANILIHLSHFGTFQIHSIYAGVDPCTVGNRSSTHQYAQLLHLPDVEQEPMTWCKEVDPMANEQTWPTQDDIAPEDGVSEGSGHGMDEDGDEFEEDEEEGDDDDIDEAAEGDVDNLVLQGRPTNSLVGSQRSSKASKRSKRTEVQTQIDSLMATDIRRLENLTPEQREAEMRHLMEDRKAALDAAEEDRNYPDIVDTPAHIPARQRFMRYRGLESFKDSKWDPFESLPLDYARIYRFQNMKRTWRRVMGLFETFPVKADQYIIIVIKGVPKAPFQEAYAELMKLSGFLTASGLRKHEHKWSISNFALQFGPGFNDPLKSKDSLLIHFGFRSIRCNPIFSEHNQRGDKHKFLRFWNPADKFAVATVYGPICYPPTPVLCFKVPKTGGEAELAAYGSVMMPDPNRIVLKKVVLEGRLYRIHKRQAIVRFMFHTVEDVNWFKPIQLRTKNGQVGHILAPLGTHGYMKCQFSNALHADDRIYMFLFKRVYPKWTTIPSSWLTAIEQQFNVPSLEAHHASTNLSKTAPDPMDNKDQNMEEEEEESDKE